MIINIRITEAAVDYLSKEISQGIHFTDDDALEIGQTFIALCEKSAVSREEVIGLEAKTLEDVKGIIDKYKYDETFESFVRPSALRFEQALEQFIDILKEEKKKREGEGSGDRLLDSVRFLLSEASKYDKGAFPYNVTEALEALAKIAFPGQKGERKSS